MPMLEFVFIQHLRLAIEAMVLFVIGLAISWPVVHYRWTWVAALPLAIFRSVLRLIGPSPGLVRTRECSPRCPGR